MFANKDNWYMGTKSTPIRTLGELKEKLDGFTDSYELAGENGRQLTIKIENSAPTQCVRLIIEEANE